MASNNSPLAGLLKLVDQIGDLNAYAIPQNRVFSNLLVEHVLSCTQQMQSLEFEQGIDTKSTNIGDLIAATTKGAELVVKILEEQINNGRKDDKQSEYVFERETKDQVIVIKSHIKDIQDAVKNSTVTRFEIHSCSFASLNGVISPEEMLNHPRTFHSIGNERSSGRNELLARCVHQISTVEDSYARLKLIVVQGGVGIGKTNFCVSLCRELKLLKPTVRCHLRLRSNTDYPMTTLEAMQYVIKTWHVGQMPQSDQKLRALYHQTFAGKVSVLLIEDPSSLRQLLELLPNIRGSRRSHCIVVVSSRTSLDLDLSKHTQGQVDKLVPQGIEEVQPKASDMYGDELSFGANEESDDEDTSSEILPEEDPDAPPTTTVNVNDDIAHLFGRGERAVVSVSLIDDKDGADVKFKYPKNYYVLYCPLEKLTMEGAEELILQANSELESDNMKSLAVLADNLPIFMKAAARTKRLFCDDMSFDEFVDHLSNCVNDVSSQSEFSKMRKLCLGVFMGCFNKWPIILQKLTLRLSVFPNSFHSLDAHKILKVYSLSEIILALDQMVYLGILQSQEPQRYAMHDLVRETFKSIIDEEGGDDSVMVETAKEQYFVFYFDQMTRYNAEHQFSGIEYTPGAERYDMELENMKCVLEFMKDRENDHIEALNRCRYLIRDRIYPLKRGQLYNRLMAYLRSSECELNDFAKSEFLEGFAYVFFDLTDYNQSFKHAHDAFELKEGAALLSDKKEDELELLALLQLLGDLCVKMNQLDKAKDYYEKVISIATRYSRPWQRMNNEVGTTDDDVILDNFLAIAQVAMARMYLSKGDITNGKKYFEKGITVLKRIFCDVHPELSDAYVQYANVLSNFKNKIFFDEIISLFERALEIDKQLFEEDSRLLGERLEQYGVALLTMGNYAEAEIKLQKAYDIAANYYGELDPYVAGICNNLAVALKNMKKSEKAEIMYKRSLDITTEIYGEEDYRVSIAKANLSQALIQLGKSEEAQQMFDEALKNLSGKPLEGETATVMASMLSTMGDAMREKRDFARSIEYFEKALTIQKNISRGVDKDIEIAKTLASIGRLYFDKGEYKLAEDMQNQSLQIVTNQYGKKHPLYATSLTSLANTKFKLEKYNEAEKLYNESMEMRKENKEPESNNISTLQSLAAVREKEKKWGEAEKLWSQIIAILRETKSKDEGKERMALVALATNMARQQKFNEAETIYSDVLPMVAKEHGDDSIEYADTIYNLGAVYLQLQKFDDAEATFATAKTIYADKLGEDHDRTREVDDQLGEIRHLIYERDMAQKCCGGCLNGCVIA